MGLRITTEASFNMTSVTSLLSELTKRSRLDAVFGAPMHEVSSADFLSPSILFQIGFPRGQVDILTNVSGISFDAVWANRMTWEIDGVNLSRNGRSELITYIRATGRLMDIAVLAFLESVQDD